MNRWRILSTKKLEPPIVEKLRAANITVTEKEFISIRLIEDPKISPAILALASGNVTNIVVTSRHAVNALVHHLATAENNKNFRFFCLNGATRTALEQNGIRDENIIADATDALGLAQKIIDNKLKEVIFLCGNLRRDELPSLLKNSGITVHEIVVYETLETPVEVSGSFDAILFFSPSGVRSFFARNNVDTATTCISIGETTAEELRKYTNNKIITAMFPSQDCIADITIDQFNQKVN